MIFATEKCPLCGDKLIVKTITLSQDQYMFTYHCEKREIVRNGSNTADVAEHHYYNEWSGGYHAATMIILPYTIHHSEKNNMTGVYSCGTRFRQPKKLIFRAPLLDIDYSQPHVVVSKLKVLVLFS